MVATIEVSVKFNGRQYKSFLKRLQKFAQLVSLVGILPKEGVKRFTRHYMSMFSTFNAGRRNTKMTIAKLAYQNEFGAKIYIRPRYKTVTTKEKFYGRYGVTKTLTTRITKMSVERGAREQGYFLRSKKGGWVAYFKPNSTITIPARSYLRNTAKNIDNAISTSVGNIVVGTLVDKSYTPKKAMEKISKLIQYRIKNQMVNSKANHRLTVEAKGSSTPLVDEQDRLRESIKYKIYSGVHGVSGIYMPDVVATDKKLDNLIKKVDKYDIKPTEVSISTKTLSNRISEIGFKRNWVRWVH